MTSHCVPVAEPLRQFCLLLVGQAPVVGELLPCSPVISWIRASRSSARATVGTIRHDCRGRLRIARVRMTSVFPEPVGRTQMTESPPRAALTARTLSFCPGLR